MDRVPAETPMEAALAQIEGAHQRVAETTAALRERVRALRVERDRLQILLDEQQLRLRYGNVSPQDVAQVQERLFDLQRRLETDERHLHTLTTVQGFLTAVLRYLRQPGEEDPWDVVLQEQVARGQEGERSRLARELHDGVAQILASARMLAEEAQRRSRSAAPDLLPLLQQLTGMLEKGLLETRRTIADLRPPDLSGRGLVAALEDLVREMEARWSRTIEAEFPQQVADLTPTQEILLYRIVQEALTNACRHSGARRIRVQLHPDLKEGWWILTVEDDGEGFNPEEAKGRDRWGLIGMEERARLLGGRFLLRSRPGEGTRIEVRIPRGKRMGREGAVR